MAPAHLAKAIRHVRRLMSNEQVRNLRIDPSVTLEELTNLYKTLTGEVLPGPAEEGEVLPEGLVREGPRAVDVVSEKVIEEAIARDLSIVEEELELIARQQTFPTWYAFKASLISLRDASCFLFNVFYFF